MINLNKFILVFIILFSFSKVLADDNNSQYYKFSINCSALWYITTAVGIDSSTFKNSNKLRIDPEWESFTDYTAHISKTMIELATLFLNTSPDMPNKKYKDLLNIRAKKADDLILNYYKNPNSLLQVYANCDSFRQQIAVLSISTLETNTDKANQNLDFLRKILKNIKLPEKIKMSEEKTSQIKMILSLSVSRLSMSFDFFEVSSIVDFEKKKDTKILDLFKSYKE